MVITIEKPVAKCTNCNLVMTYDEEDIVLHRYEGSLWLNPNRESIKCPICEKFIMVQKGV